MSKPANSRTNFIFAAFACGLQVLSCFESQQCAVFFIEKKDRSLLSGHVLGILFRIK
jgi:hypothetical protein